MSEIRKQPESLRLMPRSERFAEQISESMGGRAIALSHRQTKAEEKWGLEG
jgi:hypothetical protein